MNTDFLSSLGGLYVLRHDGALGYYDAQRQFQLDTELTAALQEHNMAFLTWYLAGGEGAQARVGFVYNAPEEQPWKAATLFFEERTIRQLYPVGAINAPLTAFQKKNQFNSYYRGMENLINSHVKETTATMFCPVLFDRNGTLDVYAPLLGRDVKQGDTEIPAIEVLNLVADVSVFQRDTAVLCKINDKIRTTLIERERQRRSVFTLIEDVRCATSAKQGNAWDDVKTRADRDVTLSAEDLDQLHVTQRHDRVERWLEMPHRAIQPGDLRRFVQFSELNSAGLDVVAARSLVYTAPAGTPLLDYGMTDHWNMYLLEGTLRLETEDGKSFTLEGGSPKAANPIAFLKPRKYKVTALSKISFLWIHDTLMHAIDNVQRTALKTVASQNRSRENFRA